MPLNKYELPWDSQPQEAVGVDWGNSVTAGLAYLTRAPQFPDEVKGRINSGTRTLSVSSGGVGATYSGAGGDSVTINTVVNGTSYALLARFNLTALTPLQQIFTQDSSAGGTNRINQLRVGNVSGVVDFIVFNTAGSAFTVSSAAIGLGPHTVLAVATASGTIELYVDGVRTSNTFTGTLRSPSAAAILPVIGNRNGVSEPFLGSINCVGLYTGVAPTQAAASSISTNPWQLFAPRSIWVPSSSLKVPTRRRLIEQVTPWESQPQEPVGIDWGNPLTRGLEFAVVPGFSITADGRQAPAPKAVGYVNAGGYAALTTTLPLDASTRLLKGTIIGGLVKPVADTTGNIVYFGLSRGTAYPSEIESIYLVSDFSTGTVSHGRFVHNNATSDTSVGPLPVVGDPVTQYAITYDASTASPTSNITIGSTSYGSYVTGGTFPWDNVDVRTVLLGDALQSIYATYGFAFSRVLSPSEIQSIRDNPWQLFTPRTTYIPGYNPYVTIRRTRKMEMPWESQPQEAVEVNPDLQTGLLAAFNGAQISRLANGFPATLVGSIGSGVTPRGLGYQGDGTGKYAYYDNPSISTSALTILAVVYDGTTGTADRRALSVADRANANNYLAIGRGSTAAAKARVLVVVDGSAGTSTVETTRNVFDGQVHAIALRWTRGVGTQSFVDGSIDAFAANTTAANINATGTTVCALGRSTFATFYGGAVLLGASWARGLSDQECAKLTANPWSLFAPRQEWILSSSEVLMPTLSLPTLTGIGSTTARPRVSITY